MWRALVLVGVLMPVAASAQSVTLASGLEVTLMEVLIEEGPARLARFRYLAPAIDPAGQGLDYAATAPDMAELCASHALPALAAEGQTVAEIVISLSDRPVAFGEISPDATQFFEPFTISASGCERSDF